jgi:LPXTG-site transpeptidase (sortase) family protein
VRTVRLIGAAAAAITATVLVIVHCDQPATPGSGQPTSTAPAALGAPERITIPAIGVDAPVVPVGLEPGGAMRTPEFGHAGWYDRGPKPGEPGPAVVVAHVDSKEHGPDVFHRLRELHRGDQVTVHYPGTARTFAVTGKEQIAKARLPADRIWNGAGTPVLRLITCGGPFDRKAGSYLDNVIVYADDLATARTFQGI